MTTQTPRDINRTRCGADAAAPEFVPADHLACCWLPNERQNLANLERDPDADPAVVAGIRRTVARFERKVAAR